MPPILPSSDGWQPGFIPPPFPDRLLVPWRLLAAGLLTVVLIAYEVLFLVGAAWSACGDVGGVAIGFSLWGLFAIAIGAGSIAFYVGSVIPRRRSILVRYVAGAVLAIAAVFALATISIPLSNPADYREVSRVDYPECGPNGIPTWWPSWLPS
jgi:hypothetical protein